MEAWVSKSFKVLGVRARANASSTSVVLGRGFIGLVLLALALAACGGGGNSLPVTPAAAAGLLAKTGAAATSPAYLAGPDTRNECSVGAAEADGQLGAGNYVYVCIFGTNAELVAYVKDGSLYAAASSLIEVGQTALVEVDNTGNSIDPPPASLTNEIATRVGGSVYS